MYQVDTRCDVRFLTLSLSLLQLWSINSTHELQSPSIKLWTSQFFCRVIALKPWVLRIRIWVAYFYNYNPTARARVWIRSHSIAIYYFWYILYPGHLIQWIFFLTQHLHLSLAYLCQVLAEYSSIDFQMLFMAIANRPMVPK